MVTFHEQGYTFDSGISVYVHLMEAKSGKKVKNPYVKNGNSKEEALVGSMVGSAATWKLSVT